MRKKQKAPVTSHTTHVNSIGCSEKRHRIYRKIRLSFLSISDAIKSSRKPFTWPFFSGIYPPAQAVYPA